MKGLIAGVAEILYPTRCQLCGKSGHWLCPRCVSQLPKPKTQRCIRCNRPALGGATHPKCVTRNTPEGVVGVLAYTGRLKKIIGRFKYEGKTCYAPCLAEAVLWRMREDEDELIGLKQYLTGRGELWLVPVPLDERKAKCRGYNQAELLAGELAEKLAGRLVTDLVVKERVTVDQVKLNQKDRIKNLRGVFKLRRRYEGKVQAEVKILLVDDVTTTGTTMLMIGRLIKRNFRVPVWGLAIAR